MTTTLAEIASVVVEIGGTHSPVCRHLHFLRAMAINYREFLSVSRLPTGERAYQAFHGGTSATSSSVQTVICLERSLLALEYLSYGTGTRAGELWRSHSPSPFDQRTDSPCLSLCMHPLSRRCLFN